MRRRVAHHHRIHMRVAGRQLPHHGQRQIPGGLHAEHQLKNRIIQREKALQRSFQHWLGAMQRLQHRHRRQDTSRSMGHLREAPHHGTAQHGLHDAGRRNTGPRQHANIQQNIHHGWTAPPESLATRAVRLSVRAAPVPSDRRLRKSLRCTATWLIVPCSNTSTACQTPLVWRMT